MSKFNGHHLLAKFIPCIMSFFGGKGKSVPVTKEPSPNKSFQVETSSAVWGRAGMNFYEIQRARRRAHRGKMYRRYGHQLPRGLRTKA